MTEFQRSQRREHSKINQHYAPTSRCATSADNPRSRMPGCSSGSAMTLPKMKSTGSKSLILAFVVFDCFACKVFSESDKRITGNRFQSRRENGSRGIQGAVAVFKWGSCGTPLEVDVCYLRRGCTSSYSLGKPLDSWSKRSGLIVLQ